MNKIICPNCGSEFEISDKDYQSIVSQIKDQKFNESLREREEQIRREEKSVLQIELAKKDSEIDKLKSSIEQFEKDKKLAVTEAVSEKEKVINEKANEINELIGKINGFATEKELAVSKAIMEKDNRIAELNASLSEQKENYETQINFYKDLKTKMSTKMVGETLEQHCEIEFNKLRSAAFKNCYFEKDNDASNGSKGDYIFREIDPSGAEIISIMFEMKNEMDTTATKHKNEDFFDKLNKDRTEKKCEYAVLVSLLEADSELYNEGIVDVSHKYPKMYVIRPQFFIPMITLLRNAALNSLEYKRELVKAKNQSLDVSNFEAEMEEFKQKFGNDYRLASNKFQDAIDEIDKSITHLQKIKEALTSSERHLRLANDKAQELSVKRLTKNSPSIYEQFENLKKDKKD